MYFILAHGFSDSRYHRPSIEQLPAKELLEAVVWLNRNDLVNASLNSVVIARLCDLTYRINGGDDDIAWQIDTTDTADSTPDVAVLAQILQLDNGSFVPKHLLMPLLIEFSRELQEIDNDTD